MKPIGTLLALLSLLLVGCDTGSETVWDSSHEALEVAVNPIVPEEVISAWGYRTVSTNKRPQSVWEAGSFGSASIRIQSIKAVEEVPDWEDAYYRFNIVEETFESADAAKARSERLKEHDPQLDSKRHSDLILRDGFLSGDQVLYATTDVSKFEIEEMPTIVASLKEHVLKTTQGEKVGDAKRD